MSLKRKLTRELKITSRKVNKLENLIDDNKFYCLSSVQRQLTREQLQALKKYRYVIYKRLEYLDENRLYY